MSTPLDRLPQPMERPDSARAVLANWALLTERVIHAEFIPGVSAQAAHATIRALAEKLRNPNSPILDPLTHPETHDALMDLLAEIGNSREAPPTKSLGEIIRDSAILQDQLDPGFQFRFLSDHMREAAQNAPAEKSSPELAQLTAIRELITVLMKAQLFYAFHLYDTDTVPNPALAEALGVTPKNLVTWLRHRVTDFTPKKRRTDAAQ